MKREPIRVLLVEDNAGDARYLSEVLTEATSAQFKLTHTDRLGPALEHLERQRFDVVLLDLFLPDAQGFDTFARVQAQAPRSPVIVLTGLDDKALAIKAMRQGAQDYLVKGQTDGALLARATQYAIERKRIEEELRQHRQHLAELVKERTAELREANEQLRQEVVERKRAEEQVRASLREKEVLLLEIHDRVKNNLQVISSLLDMQSGYVREEQARKVLQESQDRIRAIALIHERLYASADLARIDLAEYLESSVDCLLGVYGHLATGVTLDVQAQDVSLGIDAAIPCGLIVTELVSNALKHAFPVGEGSNLATGEAKEIAVQMRSEDDGLLSLTVSDNGVGLPHRVDPATTDSLGLRLVSLLTQQLRGTLEADRSAGTEFKITFAA
jgi:two-component sensor histidine kinase/ActR/RegA family two-component response regulator